MIDEKDLKLCLYPVICRLKYGHFLWQTVRGIIDNQPKVNKQIIKNKAINEFAENLKDTINIRTTLCKEQDEKIKKYIDEIAKQAKEM